MAPYSWLEARISSPGCSLKLRATTLTGRVWEIDKIIHRAVQKFCQNPARNFHRFHNLVVKHLNRLPFKPFLPVDQCLKDWLWAGPKGSVVQEMDLGVEQELVFISGYHVPRISLLSGYSSIMIPKLLQKVALKSTFPDN